MTVFIVILGISLYYSYARGPQSYSWDVEFTEAGYDEILGMYMVEKHAGMDGVYNISIWADSKVGEYVLIRLLYQGPRVTSGLKQEWRITDGVIRSAQEEYGSQYNESGPTRASTVWKIYSSSRDQKVHIRIRYWKEYPVWQPP